MKTLSANTRCLYCDDAANSREHILASGIGGQLIDSSLICGYHNNLAGKYADHPLARDFAYAVHLLDVLKGDGERGTTWHSLPAQADGTVIDILPDRTTRMRTQFEYDSEGHPSRIVGTSEVAIRKVQRQLQRLNNPPTLVSSREYIRNDILDVNIATAQPSTQRGVLKAAFHLLASRYASREQSRKLSSRIGDLILADSGPIPIVRLAPYSTTERIKGHEFHEMIIWPFSNGTFVRVSIFNIVHFLVRIDDITADCSLNYSQNTRTGEKDVCEVAAPSLEWEDCADEISPEMKAELDFRIEQIMTIGRGKAEIVRSVDEAKRSTPGYDGLSEDARRKILYETIVGVKPSGSISSTTANVIVDFATKLLLDETPNATWSASSTSAGYCQAPPTDQDASRGG